MAITSGVGPHSAWLTVGGEPFTIERGQVQQSAKRKSSRFNAIIPLTPKSEAALAQLGDNEATITVLARGRTATLFTGEVDQTDFDYIGRKISVVGRDKSAKLHDNKSSEKWVNKKPSEIVEDLIGRVGLSGNIAASAIMAGKKLEQDFVHLSDNVSFGYIIHKLAQLDGARWWVDANGQFHYQPMGSPIGSYSIHINQDTRPLSADCLQLMVHRNVQAGKGVKVTFKSWHSKLKKVLQYTSNVDGQGGPVEYSYHVPSLQQDHVEKRARSQATERARHELTVTATVVGDPSVAAGMGLSLSGTHFFDQTYDIDTVIHDLGMSGYLTNITARSAKEGREAS